MKKIIFFLIVISILYSCKKESTAHEDQPTSCGLYEIAEVTESSPDTLRLQLRYDDQNRLSTVTFVADNSKRIYSISYDKITGKPVRLTGPYETIESAFYTANFVYNPSGQLISAQSSIIRLDYEYENGVMRKASYSYRDYFDEPGKYKLSYEFYPEYDSKGNMVKMIEKRLISNGNTLISNYEYTEVPHVCRQMGVLIFAGYYTLGLIDIFNGYNGQIDFGPFMLKSTARVTLVPEHPDLKYTLSNVFRYDSKGRVIYSQATDFLEPSMISYIRKTRVYKYGCN